MNETKEEDESARCCSWLKTSYLKVEESKTKSLREEVDEEEEEDFFDVV